ncbi:hypothetical protein AJ78_08717 [Emergomyces pasteurianus Ep9510]|uniref:Uncharacterized protein n=1 Tax=Emergomyces pasteurianus Ep9510 TaxID=1447872 RepID=A0A1J9Q2J7_9EURO|nr:hypothetical protein AJ78_08717 [Emergomyces pasteurianus Ep9510]
MAYKKSRGSTRVLLVRLSTCSVKNISHISLTLTDDPIIIDDPVSLINLSCDTDQFVAIPFLQRNIEKVSEGYKVYVNMTLDDLQDLEGLKLIINVAEQDHVDYVSADAGRWLNLFISS